METFLDYALYFFFGLIAILTLEAIIRQSLPRFYFRTGIPVLRRTSPHRYSKLDPDRLTSLESELRPTQWKPDIRIIQLTETEFGLQPVVRGKNPRITHAYIEYDRDSQALKMLVFLNWYPIPFLLIWFGFAYSIPVGYVRIAFMLFGALVVYMTLRGELGQYLEIWRAAKRT